MNVIGARNILLKLLIFPILVISTFSHGFSQSPELAADSVVKEMSSRFSLYKSYQLTGSISMIKDIDSFKGMSWGEALTIADFEKKEHLDFTFHFEHPEKLRFEWILANKNNNRKSAIWSSGKKTFSWIPSLGDSEEDRYVWNTQSSLRSALDEADRLTSSVATILHDQLTEGKRYFSFNEMSQAKIIREEFIDGGICYVILGAISDDPWAVWIDKSTFVLKKVRMQIATGSFDDSVRKGYMPLTLGEISFQNVKTNSAIPKPVFNYKPRLTKNDIDLSKY